MTPRAILCVCAVVGLLWAPAHAAANETNCEECSGSRKIVNLQTDFNKLDSNPEFNRHVAEVIARLKTFKIPVHPRIRIFYELLKFGMREYAHRTADSLYVPDKYNAVAEKKARRNQDYPAADTNTTTPR